MESSASHESGTLQAFITGALVGAGVALFLAPQAGTQLRGLLRDYVRRSTEKLDEVVDRGAEMMGNTLDRGQDLLDKGKESVQQARREVKGLAEARSKAVKDITEERPSPTR